ncbi:MAG TPA: oxidoreductase [Lentisphaeria bacterium]|nr:MAG: hypothetical protein A2X48_16775 [Lentisphaerae bacterium GWF2_49_21]HBC88599.1 oxidoreductase [Lentisphaeria bacterium]
MIRLCVLGTGGMANAHAREFKKIKDVKIVACCDIRREAAAKFAETHGIPAVYADLGKMLDKEKPDAVTNVTIDAAHCLTSLEIIKRKIHVLCEKPLATNAGDAWKMVAAAKKARVINMVNFSYRGSCALQKVSEIVRKGTIGEIRHVEASYLQSWLSSADWGIWHKKPGMLWRCCKKAGSKGDLGDIGVHIFDFMTFVCGDIRKLDCRLKTFDKGIGTDKINGMKLDANDSFCALVEFKNGAIGTIHSSRWATGHANSLRLRVFGTEGAVCIDLDKSWGEYEICAGEKDKTAFKWKTVKAPKTPNIYQRFIRSIRTGKNDLPDFATAAKVQDYLDSCFKSDDTGKTIKI